LCPKPLARRRAAKAAGRVHGVVGPGGEEQEDFVAGDESQLIPIGLHRAPAGDDAGDRFILKTIVERAGEDQCRAIDGSLLAVCPLKAHDARDGAGAIGGPADDQHLIRMGDEHFAAVAHIAKPKLDTRHTGSQVQFATVFLGLVRIFGRDEQVTEVLVGTHRVVLARRVFVTRPQAVFVELDPLAPDAAEHHRAQTAVSDGQRLGRPLPGGLAIAERKGCVAGRWFGRRNRDEQEMRQDGHRLARELWFRLPVPRPFSIATAAGRS